MADSYAAFGGRNAPRSSKLTKEVNYDENNAYDSVLSEEATDEDEDEDEDGVQFYRQQEEEGDAIDGVFDHRRHPDHRRSCRGQV